MKNLITLLLLTFVIGATMTHAQSIIKPAKGYDTQIGNIVSMLEDLKSRVKRSVESLSQDETDFLLDEKANRIGALIYHLAATEKYYQLYTFEDRGFNNEEERIWSMPQSLGAPARAQLVDKPISFYLDIWDDVRKETLKLLKTKDDKWFESKLKIANMNNHWAWYHVMEHQANHMGQIRLITKRMPTVN